MGGWIMAKHKIYTMDFASVYPHYVKKAERKGRSKAEVDEIIRWLTGYTQEGLESQLEKKTDFETFFAEAPEPNPSRSLVKGVVCGVRVEDIEEDRKSTSLNSSHVAISYAVFCLKKKKKSGNA